MKKLGRIVYNTFYSFGLISFVVIILAIFLPRYASRLLEAKFLISVFSGALTANAVFGTITYQSGDKGGMLMAKLLICFSCGFAVMDLLLVAFDLIKWDIVMFLIIFGIIILASVVTFVLITVGNKREIKKINAKLAQNADDKNENK